MRQKRFPWHLYQRSHGWGALLPEIMRTLMQQCCEVFFGAAGQWEFWMPLVSSGMTEEMSIWAKWTARAWGKLFFSDCPALRTVIVPFLACINRQKKPLQMLWEMVWFWKAAWNCSACVGVAGFGGGTWALPHELGSGGWAVPGLRQREAKQPHPQLQKMYKMGSHVHIKHVNTHIDCTFSQSKCNETSTVNNNMQI